MRKVILLILITALVLFGISFYLHSIDHPTTTVVTKPPYTVTAPAEIQIGNTTFPVITPIFAGNITETTHIPPPQYASIWPETLNSGIVLFLILVLLLWRNSRYHK